MKAAVVETIENAGIVERKDLRDQIAKVMVPTSYALHQETKRIL